MNHAAILFDLDGTLVDTIGLWKDNYLFMLQEFDVHETEEWFMENVYMCNGTWTGVLTSLDVPAEKQAGWKARRDARYCALLREQTSWLPGAKELLEELQGTKPLGYMTGSHRIYVNAIDERLQVSDYFNAVVTTDDIQKSKPDPEGLLLLADHLNVHPAECIYIGDQDVDIGAANSAGMTSCLVRTKWTPEVLENDPDLVFDELDALAESLHPHFR